MNPSSPAPLSRRAALSLGLGTATSLALAACGGSGSGSGSGGPQKGAGKLPDPPAFVPLPKVEGAITSSVDGVPPGYVTFPEKLFTSTSAPFKGVAPVSVFQIVWGNAPTPLSGNRYWQALNEGLGTEYKAIFVPADAYDQKLSTMLASNDLPDITEMLPTPASDKAIRQGAFADLTEILSGDGVKKYENLAHIRKDQWENSSINGRIFGVPVDLPYADMQFRYRGDWAAKLGYPDVPASPEEFLTVMSAISKGNPVPGKRTWGLGAYPGALRIFLSGMFMVPNEYRLDGGKLTPSLDTDEYEASLEYTAQLWKAGAFHPDALALGTQEAKAIDKFIGGELGFVKTGIAGSIYEPFVGMYAKNPQIRAITPPGKDGKFTFPRTSGWWARTVIPASVGKDRKRLEEVLSVIDYLWAAYGSVERMIGSFGKEGVTYDRDKTGAPLPRSEGAMANDVIGFSSWTAPFYYYSVGGEKPIRDAVAYCEKMVQNSVPNPAAGLFSATASRQSGVLETLEKDYVNQIVTGRKPVSALAEYRAQWHKRAGDQIISELTKALDEREGSS